MDIKTKHRKSAEQNKAKGRALFALAERKDVPFAAMFAALTLTLAAYVKTAFGGSPQPGAADQQACGNHHHTLHKNSSVHVALCLPVSSSARACG